MHWVRWTVSKWAAGVNIRVNGFLYMCYGNTYTSVADYSAAPLKTAGIGNPELDKQKSGKPAAHYHVVSLCFDLSSAHCALQEVCGGHDPVQRDSSVL